MMDLNKQVSDSIRDMLRDDADNTSPEDMEREAPKVASSAVTTSFLLVVSILLIPIGLAVMLGNLAGGLLILVIGIAGSVSSFWSIYISMEKLTAATKSDTERRQYLQGLAQTRLAQRGQALDSLSNLESSRMTNLASIEVANINAGATVEAARYQAIGAGATREQQQRMLKLERKLDNNESRRVRNWQADESKKDRKARLNTIQHKVDAEIQLLTTRHDMENPSTEEERKRKEFKFQSAMSTLIKLSEMAETDPTTAQTLWEMWERGEL